MRQVASVRRITQSPMPASADDQGLRSEYGFAAPHDYRLRQRTISGRSGRRRARIATPELVIAGGPANRAERIGTWTMFAVMPCDASHARAAGCPPSPEAPVPAI